MPFVDWTEEYSVGDQSIDSQHQKILEMINELYDAMRGGNVAEVVPAILKRLETYCREHFFHEESMMLRTKYPDYLRHKAEHIKLTEKALALANDFNKNGVIKSLALLNFLKEWIQRHIVSSDRQYSAHLQAAGIGKRPEESYGNVSLELLRPRPFGNLARAVTRRLALSNSGTAQARSLHL